MALKRLHVESLRCIAGLDLEAGPGLNLIVGPNGSGKTSILESVHLLSTGKSFRSQRLRELVRRGEAGLLVRGDVELHAQAGVSEVRDAAVATVGVQHLSGRTRLRFDGRDAASVAELARALPVAVITPDSQRLLTDGSSLRRKLIDWSMFHVEPGYQVLHGRYRRALQQRNAALRSQASAQSLDSWTSEVARHGEALHDSRRTHVPALLDTLRIAIARISRVEVEVGFVPGWDEDQALEQALSARYHQDRARGFTTAGPHRADLTFTVAGVPAQQVLSRGESKLFVVGVVLGQAQDLMLRMTRRSVVLFDELASDLDLEARAAVFESLEALQCQCWVTSVSADLVTSVGVTPDASFEIREGCLEA